MTATDDIDMGLATCRLPMELMRPPSRSLHGDEPWTTDMVSGLVLMGQRDDVICPMMLRCHLVLPAHRDTPADQAHRSHGG